MWEEGEPFSGLNIWKEDKFRKLQGTIPVISLTFAGIKYDTCKDTITKIKRVIINLYEKYAFLQNSDILTEWSQNYFHQIFHDMSDIDAVDSLRNLCDLYVYGYWDELVSFMRGLFEETFKVNPYLDRAILTGITRVSKFSYENSESLFSGLNHLKVVSMILEQLLEGGTGEILSWLCIGIDGGFS